MSRKGIIFKILKGQDAICMINCFSRKKKSELKQAINKKIPKKTIKVITRLCFHQG